MKPVEDIADIIIVGTGAGGATAARVLSAAGLDILMIEDGPELTTQEREGALLTSMQQSIRDYATTTTTGMHPIPILQGRCVGGSTAINSGIIWRTPEDVLVDWRDHHGLDELVEHKAMDATFDTIEKELQIEPTSFSVLGGNGMLMHRAAQKLGLKGKPTTRNAARCKGSNRCMQGCPTEARQSMDVSYVREARAKGARLMANARVSRVLFKGGKAIGVRGHFIDRETFRRVGRFRMMARKAVIMSAGAISTPNILRKSGVRGAVGDGFQSHPGLAVVGRFKDPVVMGFGATQGYEIPMRERGYKLEALSLPPEMLAVRLPGIGSVWEERIQALGHMAQWCVQVRMRAKGRLRPNPLNGRPNVFYSPLEEDLRKVREAIVLLMKLMFAAGAMEVYPGVAGWPEVVTHESQIAPLENAVITLPQIHLIASHLFGTCGAGKNPNTSAIGPDLRVHNIPNLYVMDASALPTNMGVNPQHSIMAVAWRGAERFANL